MIVGNGGVAKVVKRNCPEAPKLEKTTYLSSHTWLKHAHCFSRVLQSHDCCLNHTASIVSHPAQNTKHLLGAMPPPNLPLANVQCHQDERRASCRLQRCKATPEKARCLHRCLAADCHTPSNRLPTAESKEKVATARHGKACPSPTKSINSVMLRLVVCVLLHPMACNNSCGCRMRSNSKL